MDEQRAVLQLAGSDEQAAKHALTWLVDHCSAFVRSSLKKRFPLDSEIIADLCQETFVKLWISRNAITWKGTGAFYSLLQRTSWHCYVDYWRKYRKYEEAAATPEDYVNVIEGDDSIERCLDALDDANNLLLMNRRANVYWLGLDASHSPELHNRQLLAAQYFYLDGMALDDILRLFPPSPPGETTLTRKRLEDWLSDPALLRYLAYTELYYSNDRLTAHLLGMETFVEPFEERALTGRLDALMNAAVRRMNPDLQKSGGSDASDASRPLAEVNSAPGGWDWREVALIFWRIRYALPENIISRHCGFDLTDEELQKTGVKCAARFPFIERMQTLLMALEPTASRDEVLDNPGLWQRLAFQYGIRDGLNHKDILDRTQPAAQYTNFAMNTMRLHGWLSNRRLEKYLIDFCKRS